MSMKRVKSTSQKRYEKEMEKLAKAYAELYQHYEELDKENDYLRRIARLFCESTLYNLESQGD